MGNAGWSRVINSIIYLIIPLLIHQTFVSSWWLRHCSSNNKAQPLPIRSSQPSEKDAEVKSHLQNVCFRIQNDGCVYILWEQQGRAMRIDRLTWTYTEGVDVGDRPVRILGIYENKMTKENGNKNRGIKKVTKHERVTFLMLIFLLHIHDMALPKSMCEPTNSNEDPFRACGKVAQSQRSAVHLLV